MTACQIRSFGPRLFACGLALAGNAIAGEAPADRIRVVTTNTILADMTVEIAGDSAAVRSLVARGVDLHRFEPRPEDVAQLAAADLLIANGAGFEPWLERLIAGSEFRGAVLEAAEACDLILRPAEHGGSRTPDPHAWQDPGCGVRYVRAIRDALQHLDPDRRDEYRERTRLYVAQLEVLDSWIRRLLAPLTPEQRRIITSHDSLAYFARAYRLEIIPIKGLDTGHEPDAAQFARLVDELRGRRAGAVFAESTSDRKILEQLARDTGTRVGGTLFTDTLGPPGSPGGTYLGMLRENALTLAGALSQN